MPKKSRRRKISRIGKGVKFSVSWKLILLPFVVFTISLLIFLKLTPLHWTSHDERFNLVVVSDSGDNVSFVIMDSRRNSTTVIAIPSNTEVEVARNLGQFAISNVWDLGESEDVGGVLVAETVVKSFSFPVDAWVGDGAKAYEDRGFWKSFGVFGNHSSNLSFNDKLKIFNHFRRTQTSNNSYIDLENTGYLVAGEIAGGDSGYKVKSRIPASLVAVISDDLVVEESLKIGIVHEGVYLSSISRVSNLVNALGNKVISVRRGEVDTLDCALVGRESVTLRKVSRALNCKIIGEDAGELDVEIHLGELFSNRF